MYEYQHFSREEQEVGLAPLSGEHVAMEVTGESRAVDRALGYLLKLWALVPASTVEWKTIDGNAPQPDEPARARVVLHLTNRLEKAFSGDSVITVRHVANYPPRAL